VLTWRRKNFLLCLLVGGVLSLLPLFSAGASPRTANAVVAHQDAIERIQAQLKAGAGVQKLPIAIAQQLKTATYNWFDGRHIPMASSNGYPSNVTPYESGDLNASRVVVVFGDSNASMWIPALDQLGAAKHFKILAFIRFSCTYSMTSGFLPSTNKVDPVCSQWRLAVIDIINHLSPSPLAIVMGGYQQLGDMYSAQNAASSPLIQGIGKSVAALKAGGASKIVIVGQPKPFASMPTCLAANLNKVQNCASVRPDYHQPTNAAFGPRQGNWYLADARAAQSKGGKVAWVTDLFCAPTTCPPVANQIIVDALLEHVSIPWAQNVSDAFGNVLACSITDGQTSNPSKNWLVNALGTPKKCPSPGQ